MSSSIKIGNKKKYILILGMGPIQGLEHTLSPEKMYSINFTENNKKFRLSLLYNGAICFFILICLLLYFFNNCLSLTLKDIVMLFSKLLTYPMICGSFMHSGLIIIIIVSNKLFK